MKDARTCGDGTITALFFDGKKDKTLVKEKMVDGTVEAK